MQATGMVTMESSVEINTSSAPTLLFFPYCSANTTGREPPGMAWVSVSTVVIIGGTDHRVQTPKVITGHKSSRSAENPM